MMTNNDVLRRVRYALNIKDSEMVGIFRLSNSTIDQTRIAGLLKTEGEEGFIPCSSDELRDFLDGLIISRRGKKEEGPGGKKETDTSLTNNMILKKIRIALELHEDAMLGIMKIGGMEISKSELTALFRRKGHKNYKECGDQLLRNFLKGLIIHYRGSFSE